ncbi:MAG: polyhydroxyalkanoate synthesis regulator DNA-binding domain-containing protein [Deltaproteobacteria bacterium]|nr:polyhydroxyalkanoate synthesis regulator DNA-binding domain-containing protein [Deltaproteobacteria bacterium]
MQDVRTGDSRIIKRYPNRKLYDTRDSRYVTLRQVAKLVQDGEDVRIIDNRTKEDLTGVTLAQILYEQERSTDEERGGRALPLHALRDLIGGGERLLATLRDSSVGKFIARRASAPPAAEGGADDGSGAEAADPAPPVVVPPTPAPPRLLGTQKPAEGGRVKELVEQSREALDDIQRRIDERVRAVVGTFAPFLQMQAELRKIHQRLDDLERRIDAIAPAKSPVEDGARHVAKTETKDDTSAREARPRGA